MVDEKINLSDYDLTNYDVEQFDQLNQIIEELNTHPLKREIDKEFKQDRRKVLKMIS